MADSKDEEAEGVDVYLNLINGVINREKEMKYDNGALQYFFGVPPTSFDKGRDATFSSAEKKGECSAVTRLCGAGVLGDRKLGLRGVRGLREYRGVMGCHLLKRREEG
jgi:hypothetical protein